MAATLSCNARRMRRIPRHTEIGTVKILPRDADEFIAPKVDRHDDINDALERFLGLR